MQTKALWFREWKQTKALLFIMGLLFVIQYPVTAMTRLQTLRELQRENIDIYPEWDIPSVFGSSLPTVLIIFFVILLAVTFMGMERNTRRQDFAFSLPVKRSTLFMTKWLIGVGAITIFMLITYAMAYALIYTSEFSQYLEPYTHLTLFVMPWLGYLALYSFSLFIGTIAGEMVSQFALTFIFTFFPIGFMYLIESFLRVHFSYHLSSQFHWLNAIVWPNYITRMPYPDYNAGWEVLIPAVATILFLALGRELYERNHNEHNGEFLIFKNLELFFRIGIIGCFALLGGMLFSGLVQYNMNKNFVILFYWIGLILFLFISYKLTRRLFAMNITVKGK
ncbi:ABC transporter permease subunit [Halalkalibacterium ligniniphilum]|uniref:ABC transporter permease subunit n=1 Tax=Halalkalibacterium ligniniphilum TaxID=1134413 RepID=UPI000347B5F8|nr:ABC transporter permease subunit [Halalkalibacterium ligniniphilum]